MKWIASGIMVVSLAVSAFCDLADDLKAFTGEECIRVVWTRSLSNTFEFQDNPTPFTDQVLLGFDSDSAREVTLRGEQTSYGRPLINHNGTIVAYSNYTDGGIYLLDWGEGNEPVRLADGVAGTFWYDTELNREYLIYSKDCDAKGLCVVYKINIADATEDSVFFNDLFLTQQKNVCGHWLCVSSDLTKIGCVWGWPAVHAFEVTAPDEIGSPYISENGCWTSMPYNETGTLVFLNPDHSGVRVITVDGAESEVITGTINHARMASYSERFFCCSKGMNDESNDQGGDIVLGRFNGDYSAFEATLDISNTKSDPSSLTDGDGLPDMWCGASPGDPTGALRPAAPAVNKARMAGGIPLRFFSINGRLLPGRNTPPVKGVYLAVPAGSSRGIRRLVAR